MGVVLSELSQRVSYSFVVRFDHGRRWLVVACGSGQPTVELSDGRIELVPEHQVGSAESVESVKERQEA